MENRPEATDSASVPELGDKLRARRKAAGLTLKELSQRSRVSVSMLSQIERAQTNPTFATVWRITSALGTTVDNLLDRAVPEARGGPPSTIHRLKSQMTPILRSEDGRCDVRVLNPIDTALQVEWYEMRFQPHAVLRSDPHPSGAIEHLTVLEGTVDIRSGNDEATATPGDTIRYHADEPHAISNPTDAPATVVVIVLYQAGREAEDRSA